MNTTTKDLLHSLKEIYGDKLAERVAVEIILERVMEGKPPIKGFRCENNKYNVKLKL